MKNLFIKTCGQGNKIIFLHGWSHSHLIWSKVIPFFQKNYECILIDFPGFGLSNKFNIADPSVNGLSRIITESLNEKYDNNDKYFVIGDSLGGLVTLKMLENNSIKIDKAVLCGCPTDGFKNILSLLRFKFIISNSLRVMKKLPVSLSKTLIKLFSSYTVESKKNISDEIINSVLQADPKIAEKIFMAISQKHNFDYNNIIKSKSNFIAVRGELDKVIKKSTAINLARSLKCDYVEFPNVGHTPQQEDPELFINVINKFFNQE